MAEDGIEGKPCTYGCIYPLGSHQLLAIPDLVRQILPFDGYAVRVAQLLL